MTYQGNYEEGQCLRHSKQSGAEKGRALRLFERLVQTTAVLPETIVLSGETLHSTNCTSSFAGKLGGILVCDLVSLILQDHDPKADVTGADDEGHASYVQDVRGNVV